MMFRIVRTWGFLFKCNYLKNEKFVSDFFLEFMEHTSNFKHFLKNKIVIANVFRKFQTVKDLVRPLSKNRRLRNSFENLHVQGSQTLVKSA